MTQSPLHETGTLGAVIADAILAYPDRVAFVSDGSHITYREMGWKIAAAMRVFDALGLRPGDSVAHLAGNRAELFFAIAACYMAGLRSVALHGALGESDQAFILEDSGARLLIAESYYAERTAALKRRLPGMHVRMHDTDGRAESFWDEARTFANETAVPRRSGNGIIRLAYTGGTTGRPKGVMLSDRSMVTNAQAWLSGFPWPEGVRYLCPAPISHGAGSILPPVLMRGGTIILQRGFDPGQFVSALNEHRAQMTWLVPTMLYGLLDHLALHPAETPSLETVIYGAAPMAPARIREALDRFGPVLVQSYGQTEAPNTILMLNKNDHVSGPASRIEAAGRPLAGVQVAILDDEGTPVPDGGIGEICVRGPLVMDGYWNLPGQTEEVFAGGWLHTGDMARRDADGFYHIVDRKKDMIISGGFNVYPSEVEHALCEHPEVAMAAVIGLPDDKWGEAVKAVVVLRDGAKADAAELMAFVRTSKGPVHTPKTIDFVSTLPLTAVGKTDRKALRAQYQAASQ